MLCRHRMAHFRCLGEPERLIDEELCRQAGVRLEDVFTRAQAMAAMAQFIRQREGDAICKLPFAALAEAEQLGAGAISFSRYQQPVVSHYAASRLEDLAGIRPFAFGQGIMQENLLAASILAESGETVSMNIYGPFTLLGMLVPSTELYKAMRRSPDRLREICQQLIGNIAREATAAVEAGASLLSYADPLVSHNMVSPSIYKNLCGDITREALQAIMAAAPQAAVHICSATSASLEQAGFCQGHSCAVPENICYGEALCIACSRPGAHLLGHGCIQHSGWQLEKPVVYELELCD